MPLPSTTSWSMILKLAIEGNKATIITMGIDGGNEAIMDGRSSSKSSKMMPHFPVALSCVTNSWVSVSA